MEEGQEEKVNSYMCRKKTIRDFNVDTINLKHLIRLKVGELLYRRTPNSNPLEFHQGLTTLTPKVSPEKLKLGSIGTNSGTFSTAHTPTTAYKETQGKEGALYKIEIINEIDYILDLDKACYDQDILDYLDEERNLEAERELYNLYGKELAERRIYGVQHMSRKDKPFGQCITFYDTIGDLSEYMKYSAEDK